MTILGVVEIDSRPCVASLSEAALEYLHDAVGIGMAMTCQQGSCWSKHRSTQGTANTMLIKDRLAQHIENSVLTGCLLRCGRIDLMIGEQSRFVSQESRVLGCGT